MPTISRSTGQLIAGLLALALTAGLVIRTSSAVFTATTDNSGNSLEAGTIVLTDDDNGTAVLRMGNVAPGENSQNCIVVRHEGTLDPEEVRVFSSTDEFTTTPAPTGPGTAATAMERQVNITIEQGTDPLPASCAAFTGKKVVDGVPLSDWDATQASYVDGAGDWDPTGPNQARMYRVTLELDLSTENEFQGAALSGISLSWATQSRSSAEPMP